MALDCVANTDAADQKRSETDDGEELRKALDVALELRRSVAAAADIPAGFRQLCARRVVTALAAVSLASFAGKRSR